MTSNLPAAALRADELGRTEVLATFFHGLSDPTRVRILELLVERPMTASGRSSVSESPSCATMPKLRE